MTFRIGCDDSKQTLNKNLAPFSSFTLYALDSVHYAENIAPLIQCKVNGNLLRYIIMFIIFKNTIL